jgi:hypothetical protein
MTLQYKHGFLFSRMERRRERLKKGDACGKGRRRRGIKWWMQNMKSKRRECEEVRR